MSGFTNIALAMRKAGTPFPATYLVAMSNNTNKSANSSDLTTWTASGTFTSAGQFQALTHSPTLDRWLACAVNGFGNDLAISNDKGATWTAQNSGQGQNYDTVLWGLAFSAFYLGSNNGNIFRSTTGLTGSWSSSLFGSSLFYRSYKLAQTRDGAILASAGNQTADNTVPRIAYTTNGTAWSAGVVTGLPTGSNPNRTLFAIAYDDDRGNWWVMNGAGGLFTKADLSTAGSWATIGTTIDASTSGGHAIAFEPGGGTAAIVACTGTNGLWVSTDGGTTFTEELTTEGFNDVRWSDYFDCFIAVGGKIYTGRPGAWTEQTNRPISTTYGGIGEALAA